MMTRAGRMQCMRPHHEERARPSLFVLVYDSSMASFDSSLTEADCMRCKAHATLAGTMGHDYSALGGFIGMGPDGAQHPFSRPPAP